MSQLDLEQLELEGEEHLAENQPAPGKATLTSRIGKPQRAGAGDLIDGATHAQLAGGLGVELSRGDGGNGGGGAPRRIGPAVGFLGGGRADLAHESTGEQVEGRVLSKSVEGDFATQHDVSASKRDVRAVAFRVSIPNPRRVIVPGMSAEVVLPRVHRE